jgi:DNA-binding transcriptional MerR regulator
MVSLEGQHRMAKDLHNETRTLAELAQASGVAARTIRYYIARGLVPPPLAGGRGAAYGTAHLERLEKIQELQSQGLTLAQIAWKLEDHVSQAPVPEPSAWWTYPVAQDVVVMVRSETAPWRLKGIRSLIGQMAAHLSAAEKLEERPDNKGDESDER